MSTRQLGFDGEQVGSSENGNTSSIVSLGFTEEEVAAAEETVELPAQFKVGDIVKVKVPASLSHEWYGADPLSEGQIYTVLRCISCFTWEDRGSIDTGIPAIQILVNGREYFYCEYLFSLYETDLETPQRVVVQETQQESTIQWIVWNSNAGETRCYWDALEAEVAAKRLSKENPGKEILLSVVIKAYEDWEGLSN